MWQNRCPHIQFRRSSAYLPRISSDNLSEFASNSLLKSWCWKFWGISVVVLSSGNKISRREEIKRVQEAKVRESWRPFVKCVNSPKDEGLEDAFSMAPLFLLSTTSLTIETTQLHRQILLGRNPGEKLTNFRRFEACPIDTSIPWLTSPQDLNEVRSHFAPDWENLVNPSWHYSIDNCTFCAI